MACLPAPVTSALFERMRRSTAVLLHLLWGLAAVLPCTRDSCTTWRSLCQSTARPYEPPTLRSAKIPTGNAGDFKLDLSGISSLVIQSNLFSEFMSEKEYAIPFSIAVRS